MKKLLFIIVFTFFSCDSEPKLVTYQNLYQIEVPGDMRTYEINSDASLQYVHLIKEKYLMIIHESKSELIDLVSGSDYFDQYVDFLKEDMESTFNSLGSISDVYLDDSSTGKLLKIRGTSEGVDIVWNTIYLEGKDNLYQICFWTLQGREYHMDELLLAAKTFREL